MAAVPAVKSQLPGSLLPTIARHLPTFAQDGSLLLIKNIARSKSPGTVSDSRAASRRAPSAAAPAALRARSSAADTQ